MTPGNTVQRINHPAPQKEVFSSAIPHPIRTPFNKYYYPIRTNPQGQTTPDVPQTLPLLHYMHKS